MLVSEIIDQFRGLTNDVRVGGHASDVLFTDAVLISYINDAVTRLCRTSLCLKGQQQVTLANATDTYNLDTRTLNIKSVSFSSDGNPIDKTTERTLNQTVSSWRTVTGQPSFYFTDLGLKTISFYPIPDTSMAGVNVDISAFSDATPVTALGDTPFIGEEYHNDIVTFLLKRGFSTHDSAIYNDEKAKEQDALWEIAIQRAKSHEKRNRDS